MRFPDPPKYYSVNDAYEQKWSQQMRDYMSWIRSEKAPDLSARYIGSLVADFHRNLLKGGVYMYPAEEDNPEGKLRLLYEAAPLAYLAEQAGGYSSDGQRSIMEIKPDSLHQCTPVFIGNRELVEKAEAMLTPVEAVLD